MQEVILCPKFGKCAREDAAIKWVGIDKDGLPMGTILMATLMMGLLGVNSLYALTQEVSKDIVLLTTLGLKTLEKKQLYRGLGSIKVEQYQAFMGYLLRALQADARIASRASGIIAGDTTQVIKEYANKIPGVKFLFHHSTKRFVKGAEILTTHYADSDKDYPLFMSFYQPDPETCKKRQAEKERRKAGADGRKPGKVLAYIQELVAQGNVPELVILSGCRLCTSLCKGLNKLEISWIGISSNRRTYLLEGQTKKKSTKELLPQAKPTNWECDVDLGMRFASLGLASATIGQVLLIIGEHLADNVRTLYVFPPQTSYSEAIAHLSQMLAEEQKEQENGILQQMLNLLDLSLQANIRAETAVFDRWFFVPWFVNKVLELGFKRVVVKAKAGFKYNYQGQDYSLSQLFSLVKQKDFETWQYKGKTYHSAWLKVWVKGFGRVKVVLLRQPTRRGQKLLESVLMCTDTAFSAQRIVKAYLLRWRIEVCYREVKQNHAFGQFHSRTFETNYGQTMFSLVAYLFITVLRQLVPPLRLKTYGWIKDNYLNAIVALEPFKDQPEDNHETSIIIDFPKLLFDEIGLPNWCSFLTTDKSLSSGFLSPSSQPLGP